MKGRVTAIIHLARYREYLAFVIITTLIGVAAANGTFGWRLVLVLLANWLAVAFAFMINDVEDAEDDALNPAKVNRNPVSARRLSPRLAYTASGGVALLALLAYIPLGLYPAVIGGSCLVISFLYSWRQIRLKTIPVLDMLSHCLMLAGLQFLSGYYTFQPAPLSRWLFPFLALVSVSIYGVLFNQLRDLEYDREAGLTHTSCLLGPRYAYWLMMSALFLGIGSALISIFVIRLIPTWVLLLVVVLAALLIWGPLLKAWQQKSPIELQQSFQEPVQIAVACALLAEFLAPPVLPYLYTVINYLKFV